MIPPLHALSLSARSARHRPLPAVVTASEFVLADTGAKNGQRAAVARDIGVLLLVAVLSIVSSSVSLSVSKCTVCSQCELFWWHGSSGGLRVVSSGDDLARVSSCDDAMQRIRRAGTGRMHVSGGGARRQCSA